MGKRKINIKFRQILNLINIFILFLLNVTFIIAGPTILPASIKVKFTKDVHIGKNKNIIKNELINISGITWEENDNIIYVTMPLEEYIKGVVFAEIGRETSVPAVLKAQAIAARCFTVAVDMRRTKEILKKTDYDVTDSLGTSGQDYLAYIPSIKFYYPQLGTIVEQVAGEIIKCYNRTTNQEELIHAKYGNEFGTHSEDELDFPFYPSWWYHPPYLKRRDENGIKRDVINENALGLCQQGAIRRATGTNPWDYKKILKYYYAINPSIIRWVKIYQGSKSEINLRYYAYWRDNRGTPDPVGEIISRNFIIEKNIPLKPGNITIVIRADESIDTRENLEVKYGYIPPYNQNNINGNWVSYSENNNPTWIGTINFNENMVPGKYKLNIRGKNVSLIISGETIISEELDSNPATVAKLDLQTGNYILNTYEPGTDINYEFEVAIEGKILFLSNFTPDQYQYVRIANPQQTPTPALTGTQTPVYPSAYPTATVQVDGFIKGLMLGMTGGADFSDSKYKEGYKAIGIAAYILLLNEIEKNKNNGYDILVNGYSSNQKYYIPYMDFTSFTNNSIKNAIETAYNEIAITQTEEGQTKTYIKTFWPEKVETFTRESDNAQIPKYHPLVFPYVEAKGNTIIQSAIDEIGQYLPYLNTTKVDEKIDGISIPQYLSNCTKAGMSAFGAMVLAGSDTKKEAEEILKYFYRPVPVILKKIFVTQNGRAIYDKEWGKAYLSDNVAMRELSGPEPRDATPKAGVYMELYFTEKIVEGVLILRSNAFPLGIPVVVSPLNSGISITANEKYPEIVKLTITASNFEKLAGVLTGKTKTEDVVISVSCKDELTMNRIDAKPESVALGMTDGMETYQQDTSSSDENHHISIIVAQDADPGKNGAGYNVSRVIEGGSVEEALPEDASGIPIPEIKIPGIGDMHIPRPDLKGAEWGVDLSNKGIVFFPGFGQGNAWDFVRDQLSRKLTFRGINGPHIYLAPLKDVGGSLDGWFEQIKGEVDPCDILGGKKMLDSIKDRMKEGKPVDTKTNIKAVTNGEGGNALLDYMGRGLDELNEADKQEVLRSISSICLNGAYLDIEGINAEAIMFIMKAQDIANKVSIGMAILSAINALSNPGFSAYLTTGAIGYARSWGEAIIKAYAFRQMDEIIKSNQSYVEGLIKGLPGGSNFPGFNGIPSTQQMYNDAFGCKSGFTPPDLNNLSWDKAWEIAGQVADFVSKHEAVKEDLAKNSKWLNDFKANAEKMKENIKKIDRVIANANAGSKKEPLTLTNEALGILGNVSSMLMSVPEPIISGIGNIISILSSIYNTAEGNLLSTVQSQVGQNFPAIQDLQNSGKMQTSIKGVEDFGLSSITPPIDLSFLPFFGEALNKVLGSLGFGQGLEIDPVSVLHDIDEAGEYCQLRIVNYQLKEIAGKLI
ncbi:MAG: SpoIID/LytB domain-containing protein [Candidatus Aenigmatarchaeota archaeon]